MMDTIDDELKDCQETIDMVVGRKNGNAYLMFNAFYNDHRDKHGSYKQYKNPEYSEKMQPRYDYVFCKINEFIESRLAYDRKIEKLEIEKHFDSMR